MNMINNNNNTDGVICNRQPKLLYTSLFQKYMYIQQFTENKPKKRRKKRCKILQESTQQIVKKEPTVKKEPIQQIVKKEFNPNLSTIDRLLGKY
jgi:hypothetical protein